jgi:hypothetical protein
MSSYKHLGFKSELNVELRGFTLRARSSECGAQHGPDATSCCGKTGGMRNVAALACFLLACGARTELPLEHQEIQGAGAAQPTVPETCAPAPARPTSPCVAWQPGPLQIVAPPPPSNVGLEIGGVIASGCGTLVAWSTSDIQGAGTLSWATRKVGFDATPIGPVVAHPSLTAQTLASGSISLAVNGPTLGALEFDETGCRFLALDAAGNEKAGVVPLGSPSCSGLSALDAGWSFLQADQSFGSPLHLEKLDSTAMHLTDVPLPTPDGQVLWERLVFDDGSFLVDTFAENPTTAVYTDWLEPYDKTGLAESQETVVNGFESAPVWLVATKTGALEAWSGTGIYARAINRNGVPTGLLQTLAEGATIHEFALLPVPNGDVLAVWSQVEANSDMSLHAQPLGSDGGVPLGADTPLGNANGAQRIYGAVEPGGARAVLMMARQDGLAAIPLSCISAAQ